MDHQLYLLEVFLETITFSPNLPKTPKIHEISVSVAAGDFLKLDIRSDVFETQKEEVPGQGFVKFNSGKSTLFPCKTETLVKELKNRNLTISLLAESEVLGTIDVPWDKQFLEMVEKSCGVTKPVVRQDKFTLKNSIGEPIGDIKTRIRFSGYGTNIQTNYQVVDSQDMQEKQFLIKGTYGATAFQCKKYGSGSLSEMVTVGPIYNPGGLSPAPSKTGRIDDLVSWTAIFNSTLTPKVSTLSEHFNFSNLDEPSDASKNSFATFDIVSIVERPEERKFMDLRIRHSSAGFFFQFEKPEGANEEEDEEQQDLTEVLINEKLCKNKNCPAAKMFKKFGIGPLATGKRLGTIYGTAALPVEYGISHTYGTFDNYGPYGVFAKPKRPDEPFMPKGGDLDWNARVYREKKKDEKNLENEKLCKCRCGRYAPLRLKGGGAFHHDQEESCSYEELLLQFAVFGNRVDTIFNSNQANNPSCRWMEPLKEPNDQTKKIFSEKVVDQHNCLRASVQEIKSSSIEPLRLRGGGILDHCQPKSLLYDFQEVLSQFWHGDKDDVESSFDRHQEVAGQLELLRLRGGGVFDYDDIKSPFHECKEIMDQLDDVVDRFKRAIGPCGKVTCPFAPNVVKETCKNTCNHPMDFKLSKTRVASVVPTTEDQPTKKKQKYPGPACGSSKCAYAKYKLGLPEVDAEIELQNLPSPTSGRCGHPKCPVPIVPELPPIHWDCPDPLPKGTCKNPKCPYLPRDLQMLNQAADNKGFCANPRCPYTLPPPCSSPYCPFNSKECPYKKDEQTCPNPKCPFNNNGDEGEDFCGNALCPFGPIKKEKVCDNPDCPLAIPPSPKNLCGDSNCTYEQPTPCIIVPQNCGSPTCPYASLPPDCGLPQNLDVCANPTCPYAPKPKQETCTNPKCPFTKPRNEETPKRLSVQPKEDICENPDCPFAEPQNDTCSSPSIDRNQEICANPNCPFGEPQSESCSNPKRSSLMSGRSNNGSPRCSFIEPDEEETCENPKCPYVEKKASPCYVPEEETCNNPDCPFAKKTNTCYPPPKPPSCDNPKCPYMNPAILQLIPSYLRPFLLCNNPNCPFMIKETIDVCFSQPCPFVGRPTEGKTLELTTQKQNCGQRQSIESGETQSLMGSKGSKRKSLQPQGDVAASGSSIRHSKINSAFDIEGSGERRRSCLSEDESVREVRRYRSSIAEDEMPQVPTIEVLSDTRVDIDTRPCGPGTCLAKGGELDCSECVCSERNMKSKSETGPCKRSKCKAGQKSRSSPTVGGRKRKSKSKYVYSIGDKYPGVQIGHRECCTPGFMVPPKQGWLWNIFTPCMSLKPRRGWRPGAIGRLIAQRIREYRQSQGLQMQELPKFRRGKRGRYGEYESEASINIKPKPTLQIKKKDGCYWITMNPLKDPHSLAPNESPYMDCTPMQFKIVKNKDQANEEGDGKTCFCGEEGDEDGGNKEESSDSELDIEFTPPAGIIHPERFKKKRNVVHCDTQYNSSDFQVEAKKSETAKSKKGKKHGKDKKGGKSGKGKKKK